MFPIPQVGSKVTCMTKWPSWTVFLGRGFPVEVERCEQFNPYNGKVVRSKSYDHANTFRLKTENRLSVISLEHVITLIVNGKNVQRIKNSKRQTKKKEVTRTVKISSKSSNKDYEVVVKGDKAVRCPCQGFYFRHHCDHLKRANIMISKGEI